MAVAKAPHLIPIPTGEVIAPAAIVASGHIEKDPVAAGVWANLDPLSLSGIKHVCQRKHSFRLHPTQAGLQRLEDENVFFAIWRIVEISNPGFSQIAVQGVDIFTGEGLISGERLGDMTQPRS